MSTSAVTPDVRGARRSTLAAFAIQGLTFASIVTRLPSFKDKFDLSDLDILLLLAAVAILSGVGSIVAGWWASRSGSAPVLRAALLGASLSVVLPAIAPSLATLVATTAVYGFFVGVIDATTNMQGVAIEEHYGRSIMAAFFATWSAAAVVGGLYASLTLELDWALLPSLALVSLAGVVVNALACGGLLPHRVVHVAASEPQVAYHVPWLPILLIGLPTFAMWLGDSATAVWSGIYLEDGLQAAASSAPLAFTAYQVVLLLVRLVGDPLVGRFGPVTVARVSGTVATLAVLLVVLAPSLPVVILGFGLLGGGLSLIPPLAFVAAAHHDADGGTVAVARVNVSNYLGYLVAAFAMALVAEAWGNRQMFLVPLVFVPLIALMAHQFRPRLRTSTLD